MTMADKNDNKTFSKEILEQLFRAIEKKSYSTGEVVVIGELFELKFDDDGMAVSIYKYKPQEEMDDDYDFDSDFITTIYF